MGRRAGALRSSGRTVIIKKLTIENFRTIENLQIDFPNFYTAICGKNDSGKSNVIRAIRTIFGAEEENYWARNPVAVSLKEDFPQWKAAVGQGQRKITISVVVVLDAEKDAGLYQFVTEFLAVQSKPKELQVGIGVTYSSENPTRNVSVCVEGQKESVEALKAEQVLAKFQSSKAVLFHISTEPRQPYGYESTFREVAGQYTSEFETLKKSVDRNLNKVARKQQREMSELLGRLEEKYEVRLSMPPVDLAYWPVNVTLGDRKITVGLHAWGSGTRNRTLIFMSLFRAKQLSEAPASATKVTPVIIIEEPECFLHPSAQAEFGRVLQELPGEFGVQVITTTHSPYMLSLKNRESNILLERHILYRQARETVRVETDHEAWMAPFGLALGISNDEFKPWHDLFFHDSECILLVEGETDREYFELLRHEAHGLNALKFKGQILAYNGKDALKNTVLLRFIKDRHKRMFVTYDLDAAANVSNALKSLNLEEGKHHCAIGIDAPGKRSIEGLLPDEIVSEVNSAQPDLARAALAGTTEERKSAMNHLKKAYLESFKAKAVPGKDHFKPLYNVAKIINRALGQT